MPQVTLLLGGARSGKSARALALAQTEPKVFVATAEPFDDEMRERVRLHQAERGPEWGLVESPMQISEIVEKQDAGVLVIDCLTVWLNNLLFHERDVVATTERLLAALDQAQADVILVSNEVGLAIAPENALARRFRDLQGRLNQDVAARADRVELLVAGLPVILKGRA